MPQISLRPYQEEVVQEALRGQNSIIWLPTGGGKTRAAVYVAKRHLESRADAKVAVLVNKVHLVDQHYKNEFQPFVGHMTNIMHISGDSDEKDFFGHAIKDSKLVICTAQILQNALISDDDSKHVELTDFTLLIIDECHHTHKEAVYNKIMARYMEKKIKGERNLPQILGLTASPGTGGARKLEKAVEHVLEICANLDSVIVSTKNYLPELNEAVPRPVKKYDIVDDRVLDPFGDHLKMMMRMIHEYMSVGQKIILRAMGTLEYETDVVELEKQGAKMENRLLATCARHLRKYNDALLIGDTVRMVDALGILEDFYSMGANMLDATDLFLEGLFQENRVELRHLANNQQYENPKLEKLQCTLVEQFQDKASRGIVFAKTRQASRCLYDWMSTSPALRRANIRAAILIGAGTGTNYMTQTRQKETIENFRNGDLNLLISTTVAEEGLDIRECNVVIRYGLLTNDIAQQQASGRARARDSVYSVVANAGGRELRREKTNEYLEELTHQAIAIVQGMERQEFNRKIADLQREAVLARRLTSLRQHQKRLRFSAASVEFACRNCYAVVCRGDDIRLVNDTQHININPDFERKYTSGGQVVLNQTFKDWEPGCIIKCATCGQDWGMEIKLRKTLVLPCMKIERFLLKTPQGNSTVKQWKDVEFLVEEFDYCQYVAEHCPDLSLD